MNLLIDNNDGLGQQDYTWYVDADHLPAIVRRLNRHHDGHSGSG